MEILGDNRHGSEKSGSQSWVAQRDDFLMHGAIAARRVAVFRNCFLVSVNSLFLDLPAVIQRNNAVMAFLGAAVGQSLYCFSRTNAVHHWASITIWLAIGGASCRQDVYLWVSRPQPGNHLFPAPEGTGTVDEDGSIFSNRFTRQQAVCSKNRVHVIACSYERLFVSNQCRRIAVNV